MNMRRTINIVSPNQKEVFSIMNSCFARGINVSWVAYDLIDEQNEDITITVFLEKSLALFSVIQKPILTTYNNHIFYIENEQIKYIFIDERKQDYLVIKKEINLLNSNRRKLDNEFKDIKIIESASSTIEVFCDWYLNKYENSL